MPYCCRKWENPSQTSCRIAGPSIKPGISWRGYRLLTFSCNIWSTAMSSGLRQTISCAVKSKQKERLKYLLKVKAVQIFPFSTKVLQVFPLLPFFRCGVGSNPTSDGEELPGHVPRHSTRRPDACNHEAHRSIQTLPQLHLAHSTPRHQPTFLGFVHTPPWSKNFYLGTYFSRILPYKSL